MLRACESEKSHPVAKAKGVHELYLRVSMSFISWILVQNNISSCVTNVHIEDYIEHHRLQEDV